MCAIRVKSLHAVVNGDGQGFGFSRNRAAHTLGEFGVVLMVGGAISGETKTLSIAIYDRVQAFDASGAHVMALALVCFSLLALALVFAADRFSLNKKHARHDNSA